MLCREETACFQSWVRETWLIRIFKVRSTPVFLPRKSHSERNLVGCNPKGLQESDRTEHEHRQTEDRPDQQNSNCFNSLLITFCGLPSMFLLWIRSPGLSHIQHSPWLQMYVWMDGYIHVNTHTETLMQNNVQRKTILLGSKITGLRNYSTASLCPYVWLPTLHQLQWSRLQNGKIWLDILEKMVSNSKSAMIKGKHCYGFLKPDKVS